MEPTGQQPAHVSPSQVSRYFTCGEQYRRIYVEGHRMPPGVAMIVGDGVHAAAQHNYVEKMKTGTDAPLDRLADVAAEAIEEKRKAGDFELNEEETAAGVAVTLGAAKDKAVRMTGAFRREVAPRVMPKLVEADLAVTITGSDRVMLGRLDVVDSTGCVRDLKTSKRKKSPVDLETDQLRFYAVAARAAGLPANRVALDVVIDGSKGASTQELTREHTLRDERVLASRVGAMLAGINAGVFLPATPGHWACTPRFCGFWKTCPYVNAERAAAAEE